MFDHLRRGPLHHGHRPGRARLRLRAVQDLRQEPLGDDGRGDRDHPQDLGLRSALPHPGQVLGRHHRRPVPAAARHRPDAEALPEALPAARRLGHEPVLGTARLAGERGWGLVSANFMPVGHAKTHWEQYCAGAEAAGRRPDRAQWRLARSSWSPRATRRRGTISPTTTQRRLVLRLPARQPRHLQAAEDLQARRVDPGRGGDGPELPQVDGHQRQPRRACWTSSWRSSTRSASSARCC